MNNIAVEKCLKAIDRAKKLAPLNIFLKETFDAALNQVKANVNGTRKLENRLMTVKDNFSTKDVETTCGSNMLKGYVPPFNATAIQKLLDAGAVMLGKTNMDEFGMGSVSRSFMGPVKNPWNLHLNPSIEKLSDENDKKWYISGGSSGGSAASVSADIAEFSIGSDTGGSVRNPAAICGCIGYKPTYGLISRYGLIPLNNYFDTVGIMTKSMQTLVDVLNEIAGPDSNDATTIQNEFKKIDLNPNFDISKVRFGIPEDFYPSGLAENNIKAWEHTVDIFSKLGNARFNEVKLPFSRFSMSCYSVLTSCEVASNFARYDGIRYGNRADEKKRKENDTFENLLKETRNYALGSVIKGRVASGNYFLLKNNYEKYFIKAQEIRNMIHQDFKRTFDTKIDILITPTLLHDTQTYEEYLKAEGVFDEKDFFTACANISGVPAITVPAILSDKSLPVGIQFIAKTENDELLLNVANWFINNNRTNFKYLQLNI